MQQRFAEGLATHLTSEANMHSGADSHYDALLANLPADPTMAGLLEPLVLPVEAYQIPAETQRLLAAHSMELHPNAAEQQDMSTVHQLASESDLHQTMPDSPELQHTANGHQACELESALVGQQADSEQLTQLLEHRGTGLQEETRPVQLRAESAMPAAMLADLLSMSATLGKYATLADGTHQLHSQLASASVSGQHLGMQPKQQLDHAAEHAHVLVSASLSNAEATALAAGDVQLPTLDHSMPPSRHNVGEGNCASSAAGALLNTQTDHGRQPSSIVEEQAAHHLARHNMNSAEQAAFDNLYATIFPSRKTSKAATGKALHLLA